MAKIGYARVSTSDQNPEAQAARLREHGCLRVFTDRGVTGRLASRPQWDACRTFLRQGDVLVVTKLDRVPALRHDDVVGTTTRNRPLPGTACCRGTFRGTSAMRAECIPRFPGTISLHERR